MLPDALSAAVAAALSSNLSRPQRPTGALPVGGGCISHATCLTVSDGERVFLKWCRRGELPAGIFHTEAQALRALRAAQAVRVPQVIAQSDDSAPYDWLLLEWLEPARLTRTAWQEFGRALAQLHRSSSRHFGWPEPNFIGSLSQSNQWSSDWPSFWRTQRLQPQLDTAVGVAAFNPVDQSRFEALLNALDGIIGVGNEEGPSLLHGDLWNGNVHGAAGTGSFPVEAAMIDPSIYYGHREVDLAMARLFGGFDPGFFEAYDAAWPLKAGEQERRLVYQLYYLLVHVNLFGGSYVQSALSAVRQLGF